MTVLVTGGAGYIGSHTVLALLEEGYDIVIADNFENSQPEVLERVRRLSKRQFKARNIDLRDKGKLNLLFEKNSITAVIHFAARKSVSESVATPLEYYDNNLGSLVTLLGVMREADCRNFVFSSSAAVYDPASSPPYAEEAPLRASNPYGNTKLIGEAILRDVAASESGWSIMLLRYFNPLGAHSSGSIGESPRGIPNNLFPYLTQVALGVRPKLSVFGNDYPTPDGTGIRDYVHVCDLARGHVAALRHLGKLEGCEAVNLGTGQGHSVLEVVKAFENTTGISIPLDIAARRDGDVAVSVANPEKAASDLGWSASHSLEEMCADGWRWQRANPKGYEAPNQA